MAVVSKKSDLFPDIRAGDAVPDPAKARGRSICAAFTVTNLSTDSSGSMYHLVDIPADAIIDSRTAFQVQNWGFATVNIGTKSDIDALGTVAKSAGNVYQPVAFGDAKHGLPAWQALGLSAAPENNVISLYAHASAAATGAGTLKGELHYRYH
ncbi:hypothetical protein EBL89_03520 [Cereibacter sphaeroides]|uniref:hypothetical protein n=1 Tax=Cereibacter sphaeroides TaxID=1063 RepID=UPI000F5291E3|nr:hypothetical protein [Cereibacter sphaeroides]AZB54434.1 hypothetical protein EBL89_03520 [Cereibacter sphaeroides]AZB58687.1 hypothetical protein EBL88_03500 [Cereibacter sphaeroides]